MLKPDNDIELYKNECDKLSALEVQDCVTSWGRWFLDDGMLSTWVCLPKTEFSLFQKLYPYAVSVDKLKNENGRQEILAEISSMPYVGEKGIKDFYRALKYLKKYNKRNDLDEFEES